MKQMSTFILPGMFIVYRYHSNELRQLIPLLGKQDFSLKFGTTTETNVLMPFANVYVTAVVFFNQFQF